jgi:heptosyltransferase-2
MMFLAGIPRRIGFERSLGRFLYTDVVPYFKTTHELERNLKLAETLLGKKTNLFLPQIVPGRNDRQIVDKWFADKGIVETDRVVCLAPGSVWLTKRWPADYWMELISRFNEKGITSIVIGGPGDKDLAFILEEGVKGGMYNAIGCFSLRQSAEIIRRGDLLITNDSAPTHFGVAVRTPVLTLFGSTSPAFGFYPYGNFNRILEIENLECRPCTDHGKRQCPLGHFKCMHDLEPETVFKTAMEMLDAAKKD